MSDFNPDEYLKRQSTPATFNPDEYLQKNGVQKKNGVADSKNGSKPSKFGWEPSPRSPDGLIIPFDTSPVIPTVLSKTGKADYIDRKLQESAQKAQAAQDLSDKLSKLHDSLPPESRKKFEQAQKFSVASLGRDNLREVTPEEEEHEKFMDSGMGKVLGTTKYLGGKATKGLISVAKGAAGLAGDLLGDKDYDEATKAMFDKAMELSDLGMSKNDTYQMENGKGGLLLSNLGGATEFGVPAMVGGALKAPAMATFALQGLGMAKEETENLEKEGKKLDPGVKLMYEYGTAGLMSLMGRSGGLFGKMPVGLRRDIVGTVSANLIKEAATKKLDGLAFKTLLEKTAMSLEDKTAQALMDLGQGYKKAVTDLTALNVGGEALRAGADALNEKPVFEHDPAELLASTFDVITKAGVIFGGLHGIKGLTKLTKYSDYKNAVVENLMADPSPQNVELIKQQLAEHGTAADKIDRWTPEEVQATQEHVQEIADIAGKLKSTEKAFGGAIPKNKLVDAVDLVNGRTELQERLKTIQDGKKDLDESVKEKETPLEVDYQNKIDQANDLLSNMIVGGDPIRYVFDQSDKKYYKKRGSEVIDEISKERYDLEKGEEQYKKADKQDEKQSVTENTTEAATTNDGEKLPTQETGATEVVNNEEIAKPEENEIQNSQDDRGQEPIAEETNAEPVAEVATEGAEPIPVDEAVQSIPDVVVPEITPNKGVAANQKIAAREVSKARSIKEADGEALFAQFKNKRLYDEDTDRLMELPKDTYVENNTPILKGTFKRLLDEGFLEEFDDKYYLTEKGKDFNDAVQARLDTRKGIKAGTDMFPSDAGLSAEEASKINKPTAKAEVVEPPIEKAKPEVLEAQRRMELRKKFAGRFNDVTNILATLADKEFREYAGLVLKDMKGDFAAWSKEMIESLGDKIKEHLPKLFSELSGTESTKKDPLSIVKEETRMQRAERGLADVFNSGSKKLTESFEGGKALLSDPTFDVRMFARELATGHHSKVLGVTYESRSKLSKLNISDDEVNALLIDRQTLRDERDDAYIQALKAKEAGDVIGEIKWKGVIERAEAYLDDNEQAVYNGGKANARALSAMRTMIDADYQPDTQRARMKRKWGRELTPEMKAELQRYDEELKKAKEQLAEFDKIKSDKAARAAFMRQFKEEQVARRGRVVEDKQTIRKEREVIVADFLKELKKLSSTANDIGAAGLKALGIAAPFMKKMVSSLIKEGIVEFDDVVKTVYETFKEHIEGLKERDILDVFAGKHDEKKATKNELLEQKNAILRMAKLTTELEALKVGIEKEKVEKKIAQKHKRIVELEEQIAEIEKQARLDERPAREREAYVKQLQKDLDHLDEQIENGERVVVEKEEKYAHDAEVNKLRELRKEKVDKLNEIDPSVVEAQKLNSAVRATERSIKDLEDKLANNQLHSEPKNDALWSEELGKLKQKQAELQKELAEKRKSEFTPNERKQQNLQKKLDEINAKLKSGDFGKAAKREALEMDANTIHMQAKVKKAQNNYDAMAARIDKHVESRLQKSLDTVNDLNRAFLLSGIKTLGKLYSFAAARSIITPIEELFNTINSKLPGVRKVAARSPRYAGGWDSRAEARAITSRWSKSTLKDSWWSKGSVVRTGAGELDRLYGKHGVDLEFENPTPQKIEFFGRLHGAFKNSTKRAEFFRSFEKRLQYEADRGKDIRDESLQYVVAMEAYADGKRAILMNDNIMVDAYKGLIRTLESKGTYGKLGAFLFRTLMPIVKIPTNYVLETLYFASGGLSAMPELLRAAIKGAENLTPKEADHAMRKIAKGQIGLAVMAYAWMNPQMFGGYYSGKRKEGDSKPGDLILFGIHIWHNLAHNPLLEAMQIAATARRAYDAAHGVDEGQGIAETLTTKIRDEIVAKALKSADKNTKENQIIPVQYNSTNYEVHVKDGKMARIEKSDWERQAGGDIMGGLSSQVPFLNMPAQVSRSFSTDKGLESFFGDLARNRVEPRLLQEAAEFFDKDENGETVKRDPQKFLDYLKEGLPIWRKSVPKKTDVSDTRVSEIKIGADTWVLSPETLKERQGYMEEFKKEYGAEITAAYKEAGKTQKDIDKFIQEKSLEYSIGKLAEQAKYQDGDSFKFGKLKDD